MPDSVGVGGPAGPRHQAAEGEQPADGGEEEREPGQLELVLSQIYCWRLERCLVISRYQILYLAAM